MQRHRSVALALVCLAAGSPHAADSGPRHHAQGTFDAATSAYVVVEGDDLYEIAKRLGVTVTELKAANGLASGIGSDTLTGVNDDDYLPPYPLTAELNKLTIKIDRPQLSSEEVKKLEEGMKKVAAGRE